MNKTILFFILALCIFNNAFAGKKCERPITLGDSDANEFLYVNKDSGEGYECDEFNSKSCSTHDLIYIGAGHFFKGQKITNAKWYKCVTWGQARDDRWEEYTPDKNNNCVKHGWPELGVNKCFTRDQYDYGNCEKLDAEQCSDFAPDPNGTNFELRCSSEKQFKCVPVDCKNGYAIDNGKCVEKKCSDVKDFYFESFNRIDKVVNEDNLYKFNKQVCVADKPEWVKCRAEYDSKKSTYWNSATQKCMCADGFTYKNDTCIKNVGTGNDNLNECPVPEFDKQITRPSDCGSGNEKYFIGVVGTSNSPIYISYEQYYEQYTKDLSFTVICGSCSKTNCENGSELTDGKCGASNGTQSEQKKQEKQKNNQTTKTTQNNTKVSQPITFECPDNVGLDELGKKYANNSEIMQLINDIRTKCDNKNFQSQNEYDADYNNIANLVSHIEKINDLSGKLSNIQAKFTTSHWTDEEGNFNKKRLVSDSVAATVLGTAGGLITSNVIKKKQVEKGFDALQCTVGGQSVATWGDEFIVGVK